MYSASSVREALKESVAKRKINCTFLDKMNCPDLKRDFDKCPALPSNCKKGKQQTCKVQVDIYLKNDNGGTELFTLYEVAYYIPIRQGAHIVYEGFIDEKDAQLNEIIEKGIISKSVLKKIPYKPPK
jgi:hypothetical protein